MKYKIRTSGKKYEQQFEMGGMSVSARDQQIRC